MKRFMLTLLVLASATALTAGPAGLVIKGALKGWDEVAELCLRISGRGTSKASVDAAAKTLERAAAQYGDDVAMAATKGGIEVAEQALRHGDDFVNLLRRSATISPAAIRLAATHSDELLRLSARYGDDVLRVGAKSQGQIGTLVQALERNGQPVQESLKMLNALNAEELPRVTGALGRVKGPNAARAFLAATKRGGGAFLDKLLTPGTVMASGISVAAIVAAEKMASPASEALDKQEAWALDIFDDPESTPEQREMAERILEKKGKAVEAGPIVSSIREIILWGGLIIALAVAFAIVWKAGVGRRRCQPAGTAHPQPTSPQTRSGTEGTSPSSQGAEKPASNEGQNHV